MKGEGDSNLTKNVKHNDEHLEWHYVYFGYNRKERKANGVIIFKDKKETVEYSDVNHYLIDVHRLYLANDRFYASYNGYIAHLRIHLCEDADHPTRTPPTTPTLPTPP